MYVHCSIRPFCFAAARLRPASAIPRGKIASSRGGGRGRGGGVERVEQSVAMDSSGMRKRLRLILERCNTDLGTLIRNRAVLRRRRVNAKLAEYQKQYKARPEVKAKQAEHWKKCMARPEMKAKRAEFMKQYNQQYGARPGMKAKKAEYMKQYMSSSRRLQSPLPAIAEVPGLSAGEGRQAEVGGPPHRKEG